MFILKSLNYNQRYSRVKLFFIIWRLNKKKAKPEKIYTLHPDYDTDLNLPSNNEKQKEKMEKVNVTYAKGLRLQQNRKRKQKHGLRAKYLLYHLKTVMVESKVLNTL